MANKDKSEGNSNLLEFRSGVQTVVKTSTQKISASRKVEEKKGAHLTGGKGSKARVRSLVQTQL